MSDARAVRLDEDQRAAIEVSVNAVVSAGAGSGKTTVLAERYLRLVRDGSAGVENILTLTFTRKAAAEMYERIHRRLLAFQDDPRVASGIQQFDRAQISTLDSFCGQIARADSARFGIPPDFSTDEARVTRLVEQTALSFLLEHRDNPALVSFLGQNGMDRVWHECFVPLGLDFFNVSRSIDFDEMVKEQTKALEDFLSAEYDIVHHFSDAVAALDPDAGTSARALVEAYSRLGDWPAQVAAGEAATVRAEAQAIGKIRLPGNAKKADLVSAKEILGELRVHVTRVAEIVDTMEMSGDTRELHRLLASYEKRVLDRKRAEGLVSFQDVVEMAVAVLRDNLDLRRYYQRRFSHIMIDEFQDNNAIQRDLLFLLAQRPDRGGAGAIPSADELDPGKLFFVGDEKQSIYLFRGADVSVFKHLSGSLRATGGRALELRTNYRSHPALIRFFNALFPLIMTPSELPFEARFEPLGERPPCDAGAGPEPTIRLMYRPSGDPGGQTRADGATTRADDEQDDYLHRDDAEAYRIATFIRDSVVGRAPLRLPDGTSERPATYDDFAILLRSGSNQIRYERMLRLFDIPYSSQTIRSLFLEAPLNDLYNLLQLAVYPHDRAAYAAVLRGPFAHLCDPAMIRVLAAHDRPFAPLDLDELPADRDRYRQAADLYARLVETVDRVPVTDVLRLLWYDYGYRYTLLRDSAYHTYLEYFDYFLALAEKTDAPSLAGFLDVVRPHLGRYEKLPELPYLPEETRGVQIMTIHKSKGLEFPVVILANTGNIGRREGTGTSPHYVHPEYGVSFNLIPPGNGPGSRERSNFFYTLGRDDRKQREFAELKRLLYVGMTRAESHLVISGAYHRGNEQDETALLNMVRTALDAGGRDGGGFGLVEEEIADISREEFLHALRKGGAIPPAEAASLFESARIVRRPAERHRISVTELNRKRREISHDEAAERDAMQPVRDAAPDGDSADGDLADGDLADGQLLLTLACDPCLTERGLEAQFGTLCHHLIQMRIGGAYREQSDVPERLLSDLRMDALQPDERQMVLSDAWALTGRFFASEEAELLHGALAVETEVPFVMRTEEEGRELMVRGQIDLLLSRKDEIVVIDFKTDRSIRKGEYDEQLALYREAAAELVTPAAGEDAATSGRAVRAMLFYLRQ